MARRFPLAERIDELTLKERVLVLLAALLAMFALWHLMLMEPLAVRTRQLETRVPQLHQEIAAIEAQGTSVVEAAETDPDEPLRFQMRRAQQLLAQAEEVIERKAGNLVPPEEMPKVLESVLNHVKGLAFESLEGLGALPLLDESPAEQAARAGANLTRRAFRHGLRIRFTGGYLESIAYLRALEALPWGFFWDSVVLDVDDYPVTRASVVVYTLSLNPGWIGL